MIGPERMAHGASRTLTEGERAALSNGLLAALEAAGAEPLIVARPSVLARIAGLWRGGAPVMVLGRRIFWPNAYADISQAPMRAMSVLQHELQHVLEFETGTLSVFRYVRWPGNWTYRYRLEPRRRWMSYGAEQRAQIVQDYWLAQRGLLAGPPCEVFEGLIPWARFNPACGNAGGTGRSSRE